MGWGSGESNWTRWLWIPEKDWYNDTHGSGSLDNSLARGFTHGYITTIEMMSESIDETLDKDEAVLDEIGVGIGSQLSSAPKGRLGPKKVDNTVSSLFDSDPETGTTMTMCTQIMTSSGGKGKRSCDDLVQNPSSASATAGTTCLLGSEAEWEGYARSFDYHEGRKAQVKGKRPREDLGTFDCDEGRKAQVKRNRLPTLEGLQRRNIRCGELRKMWIISWCHALVIRQKVCNWWCKLRTLEAYSNCIQMKQKRKMLQLGLWVTCSAPDPFDLILF
ncbi:hypothetical protein HanRHA438_Chr03g0131701 [Helianthus annuus]|uniref:Uncharacterized protein n=1 Tax=Helianthus annuus TaxID=4232 RepID=A0A251V7V1_HELAN|nr:hypothetical protein HanXRQr2_Chr03g0119861 [Helianthus annuus]KAJ0608685.1 hypothetical protein HanHA89_Chr03g0111801 [Helianthus annuus]KAJ0936477.1 hypothetical protein HanRHA438_Chr03g0131701 [Helianthus annuus]